MEKHCLQRWDYAFNKHNNGSTRSVTEVRSGYDDQTLVDLLNEEMDAEDFKKTYDRLPKKVQKEFRKLIKAN